MNRLSPIVLFIYNRPWHTSQTVGALQANILACESDLIIFSDGPRHHQDEDEVRKVREYVKGLSGFRSINIIERATNIGLAESISSGVSEVLGNYDSAIVLEDDMVTSPYFLKFMNDGLNIYKEDERVISIHGYSYPIDGLPETFFLKGADCWGWATWKRGWDMYEQDGAKLLKQLEDKKLLDRFDFFGAYDYTAMLKRQIEGQNDSWAIRWYASALLQNKLTLYPGISLIQNIGLDNSGRHCGRSNSFDVALQKAPIHVGGMDVIESREAVEAFRRFLGKTDGNVLLKVLKKGKKLVTGIFH